jgi:hypothetical protein
MKRIILILIILASYGFSGKAQTMEPRYLKPSGFQKKVTHIISGKTRSYYSLSHIEISAINVRGPGKLIIMTRGRFTSENKDRLGYTVIYTVDGGSPKKFKVPDAGRSKSASCQNTALGDPGIRKDFEIMLGRGYHTLEFKLKDGSAPVAVRYKFVPVKAKKQEWISFAPLSPSKPVNLVTNEHIVHYYRFSAENPLTVEVNGPTEIRVMTRIENHYDMKGRIHYRIQVLEKGKVINTYQLSSVRSEVTAYEDNKELIPGKAREFVIIVPGGKHIYQISILDKDKNSVLGRFLLPKKDVKLTK